MHKLDGGRYTPRKQREIGGKAVGSTESPSDDEETWPCDQCKNTFSQHTDKLLTCEYCHQHRCVKCLGISAAVYKGINGRPDLPWFCSSCLGKSLNVLRETKSREDRCSEFMAKFEKKMDERLKKIEQNVSEIKNNVGSMRDEIIREVHVALADRPESSVSAGVVISEPVSLADQSESEVQKAADEIQSRLDRKKQYRAIQCERTRKQLERGDHKA